MDVVGLNFQLRRPCRSGSTSPRVPHLTHSPWKMVPAEDYSPQHALLWQRSRYYNPQHAALRDGPALSRGHGTTTPSMHCSRTLLPCSESWNYSPQHAARHLQPTPVLPGCALGVDRAPDGAVEPGVGDAAGWLHGEQHGCRREAAGFSPGWTRGFAP